MLTMKTDRFSLPEPLLEWLAALAESL